MTIDMHTHYLPLALDATLRKRRHPPRIETLDDGGEILHLPIGSLRYGDSYTDMDARVDFMDRVGVDRQLLSFPGLFGLDSLELAESQAPITGFNDDLAALCRDAPDRFSGLAALPYADMELAVVEYRRARETLGLSGAILPVNGFVSLAEAEKFRPLLEAAQEIGGHLFIHPGRRPDEVPADPGASGGRPYADTMLPRQALDVQAKVASAMVTLLFTDFLEPYPDVTLHVANLGGTLPMVVERMDQATHLRDPGAPMPSAGMGRVHVDCSSLGPRSLEIAVAFYGADRVVLGTDCPIFLTEWSLDAIKNADLTPDQRTAILHENAEALLDGL